MTSRHHELHHQACTSGRRGKGEEQLKEKGFPITKILKPIESTLAWLRILNMVVSEYSGPIRVGTILH